MPRSRNIYNTEFPYHITARNNDGLIYPCALDVAWDIYCNGLWFYSRIFETRILAFVMMNNHFHLLMTTPHGNLSEFMKHFMKRTSDDIRSINSVKNHLYGDRFYPSLVGNQKYFECVLKYTYQNPVRAGICNSVLNYKFSTLPGFLGLTKAVIPVFDDYHFFDDLKGNIAWLDSVSNTDTNAQIKKALKNREFKPDRNKSSYLDDTLILRPFPQES